MTSIIRLASLAVGFGMGMALVLSACEAQSTVGGGGHTNWNGVMCQAPFTEMAGRCAYGMDFRTRCQSISGSVIENGDVCRVSVDYANMLPWVQTFPMLTAGYSGLMGSFNPMVQVEAGDRISISAKGSWGGYKHSTGKFLGMKVNKWKLDCKQVDLNGDSRADGETLYNEGEPAGLMLSINGESHFVGAGTLTDLIAPSSGPLRLGINTPNFSGACLSSDFRITKLRVTHCENTKGQSVDCI